MGAFGGVRYGALKLETIRYMAPERFLGEHIPLGFIGGPSKESDVYSLAVTSFEVRPLPQPILLFDMTPVIIRFSRECCHTATLTTNTRSPGVFGAASDHPT